MKTNLLCTLAVAAGMLAGVSSVASVASAQTSSSVENVRGVVSDVRPIYTTYVRKIPHTEKVCRDERIPVYSDSRRGDDGDELEGLIVGGLVGSAIGNELSDSDGAGTAGAVVGALLGRQAARDSNRRSRTPLGYREETICQDITRVREERVEEVSGYNLEVVVDGRSISIKTDARKSFEEGDNIRLSRKTSYSLR